MAKYSLVALVLACVGSIVPRVVPGWAEQRSSGQASTACFGDAPRDRYGQDRWLGAYATFDYWSEAQASAGGTRFQHRVRNRGLEALSFNWIGADFFREGLAPGREEPSRCRWDERPNVLDGAIKYGPNWQFDGPRDAQYFAYQSRSASGPPSSSFTVHWNAALEGGPYEVNFTFQTDHYPSDRVIHYKVTNTGRPVVLEWPNALTGAVLNTAVAQNPGLELRNEGFFLVSGGVVTVQLRNVAQARAVVGPLTVRTDEGRPLYRDVFETVIPGPQ